MKRRVCVAFAATALSALATSAWAQDEQADTSYYGADGVELEPITIYATLSPTAAFAYPGQISVLDAEEIGTRQPSSLGDLFESVPGAHLDGGPRRTGEAPTIRGHREEDVLVLLDGVRQSFFSGHDGRIFVEPELLKKVEVIKGPASALYGSGAIGGVIALTTVDATDFLDPGENAGVRFKTGYQSVNDEALFTTMGFARTADGKADAIASLTYRDSGDIDLGDGNTLPSDDEVTSALLKGNLHVAPDLKLTTSWVHYRNDALDPQNPQPVTGRVGAENPFVDRLVASDTLSGKLAYAPVGNPLIDGTLTAYWSRNAVDEDEVESNRQSDRIVETVGINADNRSRFDIWSGAELTLTYGGEYYQDEQTGTDNESADGTRNGVPDATASFAGVFTQAELKMSSPGGLPGELTLLPGVRFDSFTNEADGGADYDEQAISPKLAISYRPVPALQLFGSYGHAFRAPSFNELYADGTHFAIPLGPGLVAVNEFIQNPDLRPQEGYTLEGGIGLNFKDVARAGDKLTFKGSYWSSKVENFIDLEVNGAFENGPTDNACFIPPFIGCNSQFVNVPNAELDGFELKADYDSDRFYGSAGFATIDGRNTDTDEYLGVLYPAKITLDLGLKLPEYWSRIGTRLTFADELTKVNGDAEPLDAYNTIDLYAVIEPGEGMLKGFRLDLGVDNITDEAYQLITAEASEPGINYKAAVSWTQKW